MQHPDEGVIHSWLDGALSAEESAAVESHVAGCEQCRSAVAEARGFIAASSRILTALDDVPRGVVPVAPARKRDLRVFWRAAAAMLVVAGGSLVVLRERAQDARVTASMTDSAASLESKASNVAGDAVVAERMEVPAEASAPAAQSNVVTQSQRSAAPAAARRDKPTASAEKVIASEPDFAGKAATGSASGATNQTIAPAAPAPPPRSVELVASGYSSQSDIAPLKIVSVERTIGKRITTYEIAPAQTVTLTEIEPLRLESVVTTGVASAAPAEARMRGARSVPPKRAEAAPALAPAPPLADSLKRPDSVTLAAVAAGSAFARIRGDVTGTTLPNTITWTEATTGKTLTLSGNLPVQRLQEIKTRIERERTAATTKAP